MAVEARSFVKGGHRIDPSYVSTSDIMLRKSGKLCTVRWTRSFSSKNRLNFRLSWRVEGWRFEDAKSWTLWGEIVLLGEPTSGAFAWLCYLLELW